MHNCHSENGCFTANSNKRSVEQWFGNSASRGLGKPNSVEVTCRPIPAAVCGNRFFRDPESYSGVEIQLYKLSVLMLQAQNHSYFLYVVTIHTEGTFSYRQKLSNYPPTFTVFGVVYYCQSLKATYKVREFASQLTSLDHIVCMTFYPGTSVCLSS